MGDVPDGQGLISNLIMSAEWAAREAKDKNFLEGDLNLASGGDVTFDYVVPSGKKLYITHFAFSIAHSEVGSEDHNQIGYAYLAKGIIPYVQIGGNGGAGLALSKPFVVSAGSTFRLAGRNKTDHECHMVLTAGGFEV